MTSSTRPAPYVTGHPGRGDGQSVGPFVIKSLEPSAHSAGLHILAFTALMLKSAEDVLA